MIDSLSITRHLPFLNDCKDIFLIDILPKNQSPLPPEIENALNSALNMIDPLSPTIIETLTSLSQIINQYGHSAHPYITSLDISNLISLLEFPNLQEILFSILWPMSSLSSDIIGYFLEADSFVPKLITIFNSHINIDTKLTIIKLINGCLLQHPQLTTILIDADFYNNLISYCEISNDFIIISAILLSHCQITENFVKSSIPIMLYIINNSNDLYSISRILFVLSKSNGYNDPGNTINQYMISNYMPQLKNFLDDINEILLIEASITMLYSMIETNGTEIAGLIYTSGIFNSVLHWLFNVNTINLNLNENNNLSALILSFLNILLENSATDYNLLSIFFELFTKYDFVNFCKDSSYIFCEKAVYLILNTLIFFSNGAETKKLISKDFFEMLILVFESTDVHYKKQICYQLHNILMIYQSDYDLCNMIISMWMQNDTCANFCSDLKADELLIFES